MSDQQRQNFASLNENEKKTKKRKEMKRKRKNKEFNRHRCWLLSFEMMHFFKRRFGISFCHCNLVCFLLMMMVLMFFVIFLPDSLFFRWRNGDGTATAATATTKITNMTIQHSSFDLVCPCAHFTSLAASLSAHSISFYVYFLFHWN